MHHEEEERAHERPHHRPQQNQQNFRNRWEEPRPFMHEQNRRRFEEDEMRARAEYEAHMRQRHSSPTHPSETDRRQHGFSDDHHAPQNRQERQEWHDGNERRSPENQHARDRWQQPEEQPPLRERRRRHRDDDWDERGW